MTIYSIIILGVFISIAILIWAAQKYKLEILQPVLPMIVLILGLIPQIVYLHLDGTEKRKFELEKRTIDRKFDLYKTREAIYSELIKGLRGFYADGSREQRELFLHNLRLSWLYCPDNVIKKANELLDLSTHNSYSPKINQQEQEHLRAKIFGELLQELRNDLIHIKEIDSTSLNFQDVRHQKG